MTNCDECSLDILLYLDNALTGQKLEDFREHLADCSVCREHLEEELALSSLFREARPLYLAPEALRARITAAATEHATAVSQASVCSHETRLQNVMRWLRAAALPAF